MALSVDEKLDLIEKSGWPIAWDGCHKMYFLQDSAREDKAVSIGYDIYPSTDIRRMYEVSCGLKFISRLGFDNFDFEHEWNIAQFEDDEDFVDDDDDDDDDG